MLLVGRRAIGLKWVFKVKKDLEDNMIKHKAILVEKAMLMWGVDFEEVFAHAAHNETVRLIIEFATRSGWKVCHMDVKPTFLNGDFVEKVYVQ
jgi:hypothetical protein